MILYELLTGRPPYRATTTSELLLKVGFRFCDRSVPRWWVQVSLDRICMKF